MPITLWLGSCTLPLSGGLYDDKEMAMNDNLSDIAPDFHRSAFSQQTTLPCHASRLVVKKEDAYMPTLLSAFYSAYRQPTSRTFFGIFFVPPCLLTPTHFFGGLIFEGFNGCENPIYISFLSRAYPFSAPPRGRSGGCPGFRIAGGSATKTLPILRNNNKNLSFADNLSTSPSLPPILCAVLP